jgi:hypothetical protein
VIAFTLCDGAEAHNLPSLYLCAVLAPPTAEVKPRGVETAADVLTVYRSFAEGMYRVSRPSASESPLCAGSLSSENTLSVMDPLCTLERRSISRPPFYLSAVLAPPAPQRCKRVGLPWVRYSPSRLLRKFEAQVCRIFCVSSNFHYRLALYAIERRRAGHPPSIQSAVFALPAAEVR